MEGLSKWQAVLSEETKKQLLALPCPDTIGGKPCPQDLNDITFEQLATLWDLKEENAITLPLQVLMGLDEPQIAMTATLEAMGFLNMVYKELAMINGAFAACNTPPTQEEKMAGIDKLSFGAFGMADWYARRMGMTNHDEAFATKWTRIYQCYKNDKEVERFQKRYHDIISKKR